MPIRARKRWTVLIYMVADDPQGGELLDQQAVREMDQITAATLSVKGKERPHVAVQVDFRTLPGVWRRVVGESTFVRPESNAAHPETLYGFFDWAANECPAEHYLLIFWGHSSGQFGMFGDQNPFEYTAQTLTLPELSEALRAAKRSLGKAVDVIAFKDCFMATLEIAYELTGLADYLLASPGLVPVEGWPYDAMFGALNSEDDDGVAPEGPDLSPHPQALKAARKILDALRTYYDEPVNRGSHEEVPYSLLDTRGAVAVVEQLETLLGKKRSPGVIDEAEFRVALEQVSGVGGDPALVDLGFLVPSEDAPRTVVAHSLAAEGANKDQLDRVTTAFNEMSEALGKVDPAVAGDYGQAEPTRLVIDHTGTEFGGVSVFVYPPSPKGQRESRLTRLADDKVYRSLAISTDTNWADIALQSMPIRPAKTVPDVSAAIALVEQLQRLGAGLPPGSAPNAYLRRVARQSRTGNLTDAEMALAEQYAAIAEVASRLADFASGKGGADFANKGGADFGAKGGADFVAKGGADFGPR